MLVYMCNVNRIMFTLKTSGEYMIFQE